MNGLLALSVSDLTALKEALRTGRLPAPFLPDVGRKDRPARR